MKTKSTRILVSFKENEIDKKLLDYLNKQAEVIGKSNYLKLLLQQDMEKKELKERLKLRNLEEC